jgi:hypothetical protein
LRSHPKIIANGRHSSMLNHSLKFRKAGCGGFWIKGIRFGKEEAKRFLVSNSNFNYFRSFAQSGKMLLGHAFFHDSDPNLKQKSY